MVSLVQLWLCTQQGYGTFRSQSHRQPPRSHRENRTKETGDPSEMTCQHLKNEFGPKLFPRVLSRSGMERFEEYRLCKANACRVEKANKDERICSKDMICRGLGKKFYTLWNHWRNVALRAVLWNPFSAWPPNDGDAFASLPACYMVSV